MPVTLTEAGVVGGELVRCRACGLADLVRASGVPAEYLDSRDPTRWVGFDVRLLADPDPGLAAVAWCDRVAEAIERGTGLYLTGGVGVGKTHLAARCVVAAIHAGYTAHFATVTAVLDGIKERFGQAGESEAYIARLAAVTVLALDDLGSEYGTPWAIGRLFDLLNTRVARGLPTIVTSNLPPERAIVSREDEWGARRIASRLTGVSVVLELRGKQTKDEQGRDVATDQRVSKGQAHRAWLERIAAPAGADPAVAEDDLAGWEAAHEAGRHHSQRGQE